MIRLMNQRECFRFALLVTVLLVCLTVAGAESPRIIVLLPPQKAMGDEFFLLMSTFERHGVLVDVAAEKLGSYLFWEDCNEGRFSGAVGGYEYEIQMTYDAVVLDDYDVLVIGPGFAHTFWLKPSVEIAGALIRDAFARAMPIGGVSFGAAHLVTGGFLDGRTTAKPPFYYGVLDPQAHMTLFLDNYNAIYGTECVCIDRGGPGVSPVVTANYHCVEAFAELIVTEFLTK
jgi:putative intracellular protease/amidase